jgi:hypothetical protein
MTDRDELKRWMTLCEANHWGKGPAAKFLNAFGAWERKHSAIMDKVHLELEKHGEATVYIDMIMVLDVADRNKGLGNTVMSVLTELADKYAITLTLVPTAQDEDTPNLPRWYRGFGFDWSDNGMAREPQ